MTNPLNLPALISPCVGGKGGARYFIQAGGAVQSRICDRPHHYDCIVEPFAGSGAATWQHNHGITAAIAADIDPGVQAVWECWRHKVKPGTSASMVKDLVDECWLSELQTIQDRPWDGTLQEVFAELKHCYENPQNYRKEEYASAYLTLKRLVFGGVLRCNKEGKLNVALSQDKLQKYLAGWQHQWPSNGIQALTFHHSWQESVQALADSPYTNALVVIDPPYYSPQQWVETRKGGSKRNFRMTPAYPGHNPQSADEMALCLDCLDAVLATGKAGRIVVFNYWSELHNGIIKSALTKSREFDFGQSNCTLSVSNLGPLGSMNNAQKFHGRDDECVWEIGGKRMFQNYNTAKQMTLVSL